MATDAINHALAEMVTAFRTEVDAPQVRLYRRLLASVPDAVVTESADRLMVEPGRRFLPTPAEWMTTCADIVDERRAAAARQAKALRDDCPDCHGTGWAEVEGAKAVARCTCIKRALELVAAAGNAIPRPQIAERSEVEAQP